MVGIKVVAEGNELSFVDMAYRRKELGKIAGCVQLIQNNNNC